MTCGEKRTVPKKIWKWCEKKFNYWCGWKCKRCKGWFGIRYPCKCKSKYCAGKIPYPCYKWTEVEQWCYDFSAVRINCKVAYESHKGCCDGKEYKWKSWCLGWVQGQQDAHTECFDEKLEMINEVCRPGHSLPPGGQVDYGDRPSTTEEDDDTAVGPFDPPSGSGLSGIKQTQHYHLNEFVKSFTSSVKINVKTKMGICKKCMRSSILLSLLSIGIYMISDTMFSTTIFDETFFVISILFSSLTLTHLVAFLVRKKKFPISIVTSDCGCS